MSVDALATELQSVIADALHIHPRGELFDGFLDRITKALPARAVAPQSNPTVDEWLAVAVEGTTGPWVELARQLLKASPHLPWIRSYEHLEPSPGLDAFQPHYSFQLLAAPDYRDNEPPLLASDLIMGFTLQAPNIFYPAHHHGPAEIYGVISGHLDWQIGDTWSAAGPGDVMVHRSHESHAMRTGNEPALTWVAWPSLTDSHVYMPSLDPVEMSMEPTQY